MPSSRMKPVLMVTEIETSGHTLQRVGGLVAGNAVLFVAFSGLWVKQYHMAAGVSDAIDCVVVPWLWLAGFFAVSFCAIRRPLVYATLVSVGSAVAFAGLLFLLVHSVLAPAYDPWF
jgi:hypothetical protein